MNDDLLEDISDNLIVSDYDDNMEKFLEEKKKMINKDTWIKLDKTTKIKKLNDFVDDVCKTKYELNEEMTIKCKQTLLELLEKKKFMRNKDITYDKENNKILNIPLLSYNNGLFVLSCERRVSTLKSLPNTKSKKVKQKMSKTSKTKNND
tara:strand:+ start:284 stop:733 length:450 start_codon:yes stop_codon:yes gene_type:complete